MTNNQESTTPPMATVHLSPPPATDVSSAAIDALNESLATPSYVTGHSADAEKPKNPTNRLKKIVLAEGLIGSILILGAPFLGEHFEHYGGAKSVAIVFAIFHYVFHIAGGAILFKTGVDWGKLHKHH